jgi:hypothetical protein
MNLEQNIENTGYFIFSMDTELAAGRFDRDEIRHKMFSIDGSRERLTILRLINLFEEYNIVGTWAIVGHLFHDKCEYCEICPMMDWKGKYSSFEEVYGTNNPLWYGADIIEALLSRSARQEIAFHGYSHKIFDENLMTAQVAKIEVQQWVNAGKRKGIVPLSVTFPRNRVGHLDILREAGFVCYRNKPKISLFSNHKYIGRYFKTFDHLLGLSKIPIYDLTYQENQGLVVLCESQYLFDFNRKFELFIDSLNLHNLRIKRIIKGVKMAAQEKKMIHIWAHPCEFRTEKDFAKLREILIAVSEEVREGRMQSVGMSEMARIIIKRQGRVIIRNHQIM